MAGHLRASVDAPPPAGTGPADARRWQTAREYLLAATASGFAWLLSYPLEPYVDRGDFPLYLGAVMLSAWYGGLGPGLLTTAVGAFVGVRALVGPGVDSDPLSAAVITRLGVFTLEALVICVVCGVLRRTESRAQTLAASEQGARRALEAAAHQIRAVQRVTDTALTHLRLDDLLPELLGRVREAMAADTVVILLLNDEGTELAVRAAHGLEEEVKLDMRIPFGRGIAGTHRGPRRHDGHRGRQRGGGGEPDPPGQGAPHPPRYPARARRPRDRRRPRRQPVPAPLHAGRRPPPRAGGGSDRDRHRPGAALRSRAARAARRGDGGGAVPPARRRRARLRLLHARSRRAGRELERRRRAPRGIHGGRDRRPARVALLPPRGSPPGRTRAYARAGGGRGPRGRGGVAHAARTGAGSGRRASSRPSATRRDGSWGTPS